MSGTDHFRQKTTMGAMSSRKWFLENANPRQYMRNALLMNEGEGRFREAAYLAGLADADWGWTPKLEDFDEDGRIDAFLTNGMSRNFTHSDHPTDQQQLIGHSEFNHYRHTGFKKDVNLAFRNEGDLRFLKIADEWGLAHEGMSFAAAHGDLEGSELPVRHLPLLHAPVRVTDLPALQDRWHQLHFEIVPSLLLVTSSHL